MTEPPRTGPARAKVGLGRSNAVVTIALLAFLLLIVGAGVRGGLTSTDTSARTLSYGLAVVFAIPLLMLLLVLPRFLAARYVVVDAAGLSIQHGRRAVTVAWQDIRAVGIGFAIAEPERMKLPVTVDPLDAAKEVLADKLTGAAMEALQVSEKRQLALEIFPIAPDAVGRYPRLKPYWHEQTAPAPGLPAQRWRFPLPPVLTIAEQVAAALYGWSPQRWAGWFRRPWREARG